MESVVIEDVSQEKHNYFSISNLIMDLGTTTIRDKIMEQLGNSGGLESILGRDEVKTKLNKLFEGKIINERQWKILYPPPEEGKVNVHQFDITLWLVLMQNLVLKDRWFHRMNGKFYWINYVNDIKTVRNELCHLPKPELDDETFNFLWSLATNAITRLDSRNVAFDSYKTGFDENKVKLFRRHMSEQILQESNSRLYKERRHSRCAVKCLIGLFVSILVISALSAYLTVYFIRQNKPCQRFRYSNATNKGIIHIVTRKGWGADPPSSDLTILTKPAKYLIYTHTADTAPCKVADDCCVSVKGIQYSHMHREKKRFSDIGFHYLIDSSGLIYEGRSLDYWPAAAYGWNNHTISVALIGNYMYDIAITGEMIGALDTLLTWLVLSNVLEREYIMYAMCEIRPTDSPGRNLYNRINELTYTFPHVQHRNDTYCYFNNSITAW